VTNEERGGGLGGLFGKAEDALGKFMDDPEKVGKAKGKAEGLLGKYMDQDQASKVTDVAEQMLGKVAHNKSPDAAPEDR
jgi:hypothetical protein